MTYYKTRNLYSPPTLNMKFPLDRKNVTLAALKYYKQNKNKQNLENYYEKKKTKPKPTVILINIKTNNMEINGNYHFKTIITLV